MRWTLLESSKKNFDCLVRIIDSWDHPCFMILNHIERLHSLCIIFCIPESFNTNVSHHLFDNSTKIWYDEFN